MAGYRTTLAAKDAKPDIDSQGLQRPRPWMGSLARTTRPKDVARQELRARQPSASTGS